MTTIREVDIAVIGAGIAGIATAYYLCTEHAKSSVLLIDSRQPMSYTSAQSGDNYRNWWPHPTMTRFTNDSIDLMEKIALDSSNVLNMTRRGYALATRRGNIDDLIEDLHTGYGSAASELIRIHGGVSAKHYRAPDEGNWQEAPAGVDILVNQNLIRRTFVSFASDIANVVHIRRAGDISGQQLGQYMLQRIKQAGGKRMLARLRNIEKKQNFTLDIEAPDGAKRINAAIVVNAAGPFAQEVAAMIGIDVPIKNVFQQKIAFEDDAQAIPRQLPFVVDLDAPSMGWTDEERSLLADDPDMAWLTRPIPGGIHCRPEGGDRGKWVKLGWAYNANASDAQQELANDRYHDSHFPEIVMRGATALNPSLQQYLESFPGRWTHYGGYYPMTRENWPLIGPSGVDGAFIVGALSGFGSMSACAAGALCAAWIKGKPLPDYAGQLSLSRSEDEGFIAEIEKNASKGIL